ncbi:c-type cytochrome [Novosphingobium sp.]|jgi:cytochrome c|uniref:c-type cytochrome n=1 Tax=Novosphingobium sp. TaxID=1874826 RepID=UPI001EBC3486|nr:c-type cytochrome [Novosphingobium sp.]MBK6800211.1 c-type cytochrome [Novosphingobium sp.]MBK9010772.1 c-type cytochrome [Novosphingobium sp.]
MQPTAAFAMTGLALLLSACGSRAEAPVEQIVVRQPGAVAASAPVGAPDAGDPVAAGKVAFAACAACHSAAPGAASGIGPNLHGVVGRAAGSAPGFSYSPAISKSGITWTERELDTFLANPAAKVPGTSMAAGQVTDAPRRAAIIAYLASLKD